jgi:hypothetical protein
MLLGLPLISYLSFFTEERGTLRLGRGSRRISKTNGPLIDDRRSTRGNRFATGDRAAIEETVGLRDGPPLLEAQPKILKSIDASNSVGLRAERASVSSDEWRVDFPKSLDHFEFDLPSRLCQAVVVFRPSFRHAWLEAVGAIGDSVLGDGPQHLLIQGFQVFDSTMCLLADHGLKGHQHLERRLETDGSRRDSVLAGRLSHDRTDQVVSQDVRPNLLADQLWRLAA